MRLTARDEQIIETLLTKVRVMHAGQAARAFWPGASGDPREVRRRLSRLAAAGFVGVHAVLARHLPATESPVLRWAPREPPPDFDAASWRLQARWTMAPRPSRVYVAGKRAGAMHGLSAGRLRKPLQVDHDLALAEAYVAFLRRSPALAARWLVEDRLPKGRRGQRQPDALVFAADGRTAELAIESGGAYPAERVASFHAFCQARNLPYELW